MGSDGFSADLDRLQTGGKRRGSLQQGRTWTGCRAVVPGGSGCQVLCTPWPPPGQCTPNFNLDNLTLGPWILVQLGDSIGIPP